jgi:hypothetical protein
MDTEKYLKLAALGAILIIALLHPIVSAFVLTGVAAWHLQDIKISDMALVQKIVRLTPPAIKTMVTSRSTEPVKLALPAPDPVRDAVPYRSEMVDAAKTQVLVGSNA